MHFIIHMLYLNFRNVMYSLNLFSQKVVPHYRKYGQGIFGRLSEFPVSTLRAQETESLLNSYHHCNPRMPFNPSQPLYGCCLLLKNSRVISRKRYHNQRNKNLQPTLQLEDSDRYFVFQLGMNNAI